MHRKSMGARGWLTFASVLAVVSALACVHQPSPKGPQPTAPGPKLSAQIPGRDLRRDPPRIDSLQVRLLSTANQPGNATLMAHLAEGEVRLERLSLDDEGRIVVLHDDGREGDEKAGDGVLSGAFQLDVERLEANRRRIADFVRSHPEEAKVPVLRDRVVVGERRVRFPAEPLGRGSLVDLTHFDFGLAALVDPEKSLLIRDPAVVADPTRTYDPCTGGPAGPLRKWSFGYLMDEMYNNSAPPATTSDFILHWLAQWNAVQVPNNLPVPARAAIVNRIINPWIAASGGGPTLDLTRAPFRLAAIVNRLDLGDNPAYGGGNAGELRFVFGAVDLTNNCNPLPFAVIFEYGAPISGCFNIRSWAQQWEALGGLAPAFPAFRAALEAITEQVVVHGLGGAKPNGSALNQLRSNEIALAAPWELREFRLQTDHTLRMTTVAQAPTESLDGTPNLANFINANAPAILAGTHVVPLSFPNALTPFRGGAAPVPPFFWNAPGIVAGDERRFKFSLATCNGCHGLETDTRFLHIDPQVVPAALSNFLIGGPPVASPVAGEPAHSFHDLLDRAANLDAVANSSCFLFLGQVPPFFELFPQGGPGPGPIEEMPALPSLPRTRMVH